MMAAADDATTSAKSSIPDFYRGKSILITGGTGFIGKVLIEKLLSSCPEIQRIYLLVRPSRDGKSPQQRVADEIIKSRLFTLRKFSYDFSKLTAIAGDITKPELGLSPEDYQTLCDQVDLVFHSAATVRFHGPLKKYIQQNVQATESVMKLGRNMHRLLTIVYVSTAYANCDRINVEEKVYPVIQDDVQTKMIDRILEENSDRTPEPGDPELLGRPNSYTASKAIAETLVEQRYSDLPVVICRPSIVTHALVEPAPGWCDSFNGLAGTLLLGGLGIARTMEVNCDFNADLIPVDFVANSLIVIGHHYSVRRHQPNQQKSNGYSNGAIPSTASSSSKVPVVNLTVGPKNPVTWGQVLDYARQEAIQSPSIKMIRPVAKNPVSARGWWGAFRHRFILFFSHIVFAHIFDTILWLAGKKRMMVDVTNKMHRAFEVLEHFTNHQWIFYNDTYRRIYQRLTPEEQKRFPSDVTAIDWPKYGGTLYMGCRRYLLNEDDSTIPAGRRRQQMLTWTYRTFKTFLYICMAILVAYMGFLILPSSLVATGAILGGG